MKGALKRAARREPDDAALATAWQAASLLIGYPDEELLERRPLLRRAVRSLPETVRAHLEDVLDHLDATPLRDLQADYVATFDHRKRCCLYLSYYAYGDTRKRGMALLRFKHAYGAAGLDMDEEELPDHLAVVLEFAATGDLVQGRRLLLENRAGLELLRRSLRDAGSPWAPVVEAVSATLPALSGRDRDSVTRLIAEGPPEEEVGLSPYGAGQAFLPDPTMPDSTTPDPTTPRPSAPDRSAPTTPSLGARP